MLNQDETNRRAVEDYLTAETRSAQRRRRGGARMLSSSLFSPLRVLCVSAVNSALHFLRRQQKTPALIYLSLSLLAATGCGGSSSSDGKATLTLGAYTTPRE